MRKTFRLLLAGTLLLATAAPLAADTIRLKDGSVIRGQVVGTRPDEGLAFIDKMSQRYTGQPYRFRERPREIFLIKPDHVIAQTGR